MFEVSEDVELVDLVEALYTLVLRLAADSVAFKNSHVKIAACHERVEVLQSDSNAPCSDEGLVDKVALRELCLVRHEECEFMIGRSRPQVRSLLQIKPTIVSVVIFTFTTLLVLLEQRNLKATVGVYGAVVIYFYDFVHFIRLG